MARTLFLFQFCRLIDLTSALDAGTGGFSFGTALRNWWRVPIDLSGQQAN